MELETNAKGFLTAESAEHVVAMVLTKKDNREELDATVVRGIESRGVIGVLPIDSISINSDNPRDGEWQDDVDDLVKEIGTTGFDKSQPLTVVVKGPSVPENLDGVTATVVRGNRRLTAIKKLRDESPEVFEVIFPEGTVPVVMFAGLTKTEQAVLTVDFGKGRKRRELNAYELFLAVRTFVKAGHANRDDIGKRLGKSGSWAQPMIALSKMPKEVFEAFRPVLTNKLTETKLRKQDILFVARDYANTADFVNSPVWKSWKDGKHKDGACAKAIKSGGKGKDERLNYTDLVSRAEAFDSPTVKDLLKTTDMADFAVELDSRVQSLETDANMLRDIRKILAKDEYASLVGRVKEYRAAEKAKADAAAK